MSPTRRSRVMLGKTLASAERTASIRGVMVAIPWLTLPAIDPEASNTSMASSMQGLRSESSACARMGADKIAAMPRAAGKDRERGNNATATFEEEAGGGGGAGVAGPRGRNWRDSTSAVNPRALVTPDTTD